MAAVDKPCLRPKEPLRAGRRGSHQRDLDCIIGALDCKGVLAEINCKTVTIADHFNRRGRRWTDLFPHIGAFFTSMPDQKPRGSFAEGRSFFLVWRHPSLFAVCSPSY